MSLILPGIVAPTENDSTAAPPGTTAPFMQERPQGGFTKLLGDKLSQINRQLSAKHADKDDAPLAVESSGLEQVDLTSLFATLDRIVTATGSELLSDELAGDLTEDSLTRGDSKTDVIALTLPALLAMLPQQITTETLAQSSGTRAENDAVAGGLTGFFSQKRELIRLAQDDQFTALNNTIAAKNQAVHAKTDQLNINEPLPGGTSALTALAQMTDNLVSEKTSSQPVTINSSLSSLSSIASTTATNGSVNTASLTTQLNARLGTPEWQQTLGQQVLLFSRNGQQNVQLRLHPQELGTLHVSLRVEDNMAQLHFVSAHSQVRAALEAAMPGLRNALAEGGIQLGQSSVSSESSSQWQQGQQSAQGHHSDTTTDATVQIPLTTAAVLQSLAAGRNGVDIFA